jgi:hypothetical protein
MVAYKIYEMQQNFKLRMQMMIWFNKYTMHYAFKPKVIEVEGKDTREDIACSIFG